MNVANVLRGFEVFHLKKDEILSLNKHDPQGQINNVIIGIAANCFCTILLKENPCEYDHLFVSRDGDLKAICIRQALAQKTRNEHLILFSRYIAERHSHLLWYHVFNTFQHQARSLFEKLNYWTYDKDEIPEKGVMFLPRGYKGIAFTPFYTSPQPQPSTDTALKEPTQHFVYIMYNRRNNYYKIGHSTDPVYREKTLQAEEPEIILLNKWFASPATEAALHQKFKYKRIRGEWFNLSPEDLSEINDYMLSLNQ